MKIIDSKSSNKRLLAAGIIAAMVTLVAIVLWWQGDRIFPASNSDTTIREHNLQSISPDPTTLIGQWIRQDGGYVIRIESFIAPDKLTASYFNPNPIHVSQASYNVTDGKLGVFVQLQDTGYPGCTYKLTYDAANGALVGEYYQAAMNETYQIAFARVSSPTP